MKNCHRPVLLPLESAALILFAGTISAQTATSANSKNNDDLTEVIVTGVRAGVVSALNAKKDADQRRESTLLSGPTTAGRP